MAGLIAICLCLTVTILELMKLKREAQAEAAAKEEAAKSGPTGHSFHKQVRAVPTRNDMLREAFLSSSLHQHYQDRDSSVHE